MFNKLKNKLNTTLKNIKTVRNPQPKFINPYAMSETVTQQLHVKPEFKDGRFILTPQSDDPRNENIPPEVPKEEPKKPPKEPGISKYIKDVLVSDLEKIAGESRRKIKRNPIIKAEDVIELKPPALEPEVIEPDVIEPEVIPKVKLVNPNIEIHAVIDLEEIEREEAKDLEELKILSESVDRAISKFNTKQNIVISGGTVNYTKTALRRAEIYKKQESETQ